MTGSRKFVKWIVVSNSVMACNYSMKHYFLDKTNLYKRSILEIKSQIESIGLRIYSEKGSSDSQWESHQQKTPQQLKQEELEHLNQLFQLFSDPEVTKFLSSKSRAKLQCLIELKKPNPEGKVDQFPQALKKAAVIFAINAIGAVMAPNTFWFGSCGCLLLSQISLMNDLYTLKFGKRGIQNLPEKQLTDLYLAGSSVVLGGVVLKRGAFKMIEHMKGKSKDIVKKN